MLEDRRLLTVAIDTLHVFSGGPGDGASPQAGLTLVGSTLFGTTASGGSDGDGTIFSVNTDGSDYQTLYSFGDSDSDGQNPAGSLALVGSTLYGTTENGGSDGEGTIFSISTDGTGYQVLYAFSGTGTDAENPLAGLTPIGSTLYGTTEYGGDANDGAIFSINTDGSGYQVLHSFGNSAGDGTNPVANLTRFNSVLWGTTENGGSGNQGMIFSIHYDGTGYKIRHSFADDGIDGQNPVADLTLVGSTLFGTTANGGTNAAGSVFSIATDGSNYQSLYSFGADFNDGVDPASGLTLDGSSLYGTTVLGGDVYAGTIYSINTDGSDYQVQHAFGDSIGDGLDPASDLTLVGSTLFGTTQYAGGGSAGTIFATTSNTILNASGSSPTYSAGEAAVAVDSGLAVSSTDTDLTGATETISSGTLASGDVLNFIDQNGISGSYSAGTLTLSGSATVAQYQAALQSVTFSTTSFSATTRSISIAALDGAVSSNTVAEQVMIAVPALAPSGTTNTFFVGGVAVAVDASLTVGYSGADLTGATETISPGTLQSGDTLNFTNQNGISGSYAGGLLTLSGSATAGQYQTALQSVTFSSTSNSTSTRAVSIVAFDHALDSNTVAESVDVAIASPVLAVPLQTQYLIPNSPTNGRQPLTGLTAVGTTLFGIEGGGSNGYGELYSINSDGSNYHSVYSFTGSTTGGAGPYGGLTLVGSTLVGKTQSGGAYGDGTIYSIQTDGTGFQILHSFSSPPNNGTTSTSSLTLVGSTLFGMTSIGGASNDGTVFSINTDGSNFQTLHTFTGTTTDGANPYSSLTLVGSNLVGTTNGGGKGYGTVFAINTDGTGYHNLYSFTEQNGDGGNPDDGVTLVGSTLFGTAYSGGAHGDGMLFSMNVDGSGYKVVYTFSGNDGRSPVAPLTLLGSTLYGTTVAGGSSAYGTVFSIRTDGSQFQVLRTFTNSGNDGALPYAGLTAVGLSLFGTTSGGGIGNSGIIYGIPHVPNYTAGGAAVAVAPELTVTIASTTTEMNGATVTISSDTLRSGDIMTFTSPTGSGISGNYAGGVLTLSGTATPAQYTAALQSVMFSNPSNPSTTARSISIVGYDGAPNSNTVSQQVIVSSPITVSGAWVMNPTWGSSGNTNFFGYLASHSLGSATLGYALKTGASQLTVLPFANINTISVQFSGAVSNIGLGSLKLAGGTGGGATGAATVAPSVTGFTSDGNNTYSWTLSANLTNNKYVFAIATTGSSFGTPGSTQVTDASGAGISGSFTTGSSTFPSGNGLAGSTFDFAFNVLPGDGLQNGIVSVASTSAAKALNNDKETAAAYNPYYDYNGAGIITVIDASLGAADNNDKQSSITAPTAPSASQAVVGAGSAGFAALALAVQETGGSQVSGSQSSSAGTVSAISAGKTPATTQSATATNVGGTPATASGIATATSTVHRGQHGRHQFAAVDAAVSEFDLSDTWI